MALPGNPFSGKLKYPIPNLNLNVGELPSNLHYKAQWFSLIFLQGMGKKILEFIYQECKKNLNKFTRPIRRVELAEKAHCSVPTATTTVHRLVKKGYLICLHSYPGRMGSTIYQLPDRVYHFFCDEEKKEN